MKFIKWRGSETSFYPALLATLPSEFDEVLYLAANVDVNEAVSAGTFASGAAHFLSYGHLEGRSLRPVERSPVETETGHPRQMVHVGRDGWLFLTGGTNQVLAQYDPSRFSREHLARWKHLLEERVRLCRDCSTRYYNVAIPEKLSVYDHKLDGLSVDVRLSPATRLRRSMLFSGARRHHIDLVRPFRAYRDRTQLYHKTDTHWTFAGCYLAYILVCRRLGVRPRTNLADPAYRGRLQVTGDLGNKLEPSRDETVESWCYPRSAARIHVNSLVRHFENQGGPHWGGVGSHVVYRSEAHGVDSRRLVFFGDSYSHHAWHPWVGGMTAMLAETFSEVHFIWTSAIDWNYVKDVRPDFVLTEIAERFMIELPLLRIDLKKLEAEALGRKVG